MINARTSRPVSFLAAGLLAVTAGCARRESAVEHGNRHGILHLGNGAEPQNLDPHAVTGVSEHNILSAILEGLVDVTPGTLDPRPGTATHWDISDDGRVYIFHLRPEARWSNGDPVTADDFIFSYRRILSPALGAPYAYMLYSITGAEAYHRGETDDFESVGLAAPDPHTLVITLRAPVPYFLSLLTHAAWYPVHPPTILTHGAIDDIRTPWIRPGNFVGNGPFVLTEWVPNKVITVTKIETYWDRERVGLNAIHYHAIADNTIEEHAFRAGQLHVTGTVPMDRIDHYRRHDPDRLLMHPYLGTYYFLFNTRRPPLDDPRVRLALALAVDRERITTYVTRGGEAPARRFTPPGIPGYDPDISLQGGPDEARALLAEAGYPGGEGLRPLELLFNTSDAHAEIAAVLQQMWRQELGVEVRLINMEWRTYLDQTQRGAYDIARAGWIADYIDPGTFLNLFVTDGGNNRSGWSNPDYDDWIRGAAMSADPAERMNAFVEAEAILAREAPVMTLYYYVSKSLIQPSVSGWIPNVLDRHPVKDIRLVAE